MQFNILVPRTLCLAAAIGLSSNLPATAETLTELAQKTHYHGIAFNRSGTAVLLLASHHGLFAVTKDGTATRLSPLHDYMGFSPDPADPFSYFASGHPATGGNSGFLHSRDGGATWTQLSEGMDGPVDFHQMDVSPVDPMTIYGSYRQIQVSHDGGQNWSIAGETPPALIAIAASSSKADRLYATTKDGLYVSDDAGTSWASANFQGEIVPMVRTGPEKSIDAFVLGKGLLKATESSSERWTTLSNGFGEAIPLHLAIDLKDDNHLALESLDGGVTWKLFGAPPQ